MAEFEYQNVEAWNTAVKLAASVGRLKIGSNLKASENAQQQAFEQAGLASALIAEGSGREGPAQVALYRDARGALAQCRSWIHILAAVTNEQDSVFGNELDLAEQASRQVSAYLRTIDRAPGGPAGAPRPPMRPQGGQGPRPPRGGAGPR
jgi:hypothetical protein